MSFKMRRDAENWFSNIKDQKPIQTKFDLYYFCLMLGLAKGRKSNPTRSEVTDFVDYFVSDYKKSQRLIIGLLIGAELSRLGIEATEKNDVRQLFNKLVDPTTPTNLTDAGMDALNQYSSGGYDYLAAELNSKPHYVEEFLRSYDKLLKETVDSNSDWLV
ncbi:MAG: hypothetical protein SXA11_14260 [Cyanobacteriota bacterium]|nr:hypothetical protein [Cyanobacteriota bacterium]